jgi:hypothetical protein
MTVRSKADECSLRSGTELTVTHRGLSPLPEELKGYAQGWPGLVTRIKQLVETEH